MVTAPATSVTICSMHAFVSVAYISFCCFAFDSIQGLTILLCNCYKKKKKKTKSLKVICCISRFCFWNWHFFPFICSHNICTYSRKFDNDPLTVHCSIDIFDILRYLLRIICRSNEWAGPVIDSVEFQSEIIIYFEHECHIVGILIEFKRNLKAKYVSLQFKFMNDRFWDLTRFSK